MKNYGGKTIILAHASCRRQNLCRLWRGWGTCPIGILPLYNVIGAAVGAALYLRRLFLRF